MSPVCAAIDNRPSRVRSRLTNGSTLLAGIDGRSAEARRYRDLLAAFTGELGGDDRATEADRALCKQAAALTVRSEALQAAMVRGEAVDDEQLVRVTNALTRVLTALRSKVRRKGPSAREAVLARHAAAQSGGGGA